MALFDDTGRFYRPHFVKGLPSSGYCLTLNKDGVGELNQIKDKKNFQSNGQRFSIEVQPNSTICACEISSDGNLVLTSDKSGFLHLSSLDDLVNRTDGNRATTKHIRINDIAHKSSNDLSDADQSTNDPLAEPASSFDLYERNFKIRPHFFLSQNLNNRLNRSGDILNEITFSRCYNHWSEEVLLNFKDLFFVIWCSSVESCLYILLFFVLSFVITCTVLKKIYIIIFLLLTCTYLISRYFIIIKWIIMLRCSES